jgi:type I restriction-modification system DNA methylase subunit
MFAIATTNMILRGDGQSNLICGDFCKQSTSDLQLWGGGVTVGFMNQPYSQAKNRATAHLSELCFIRQLLNSVTSGGRVAVIVPVSAMIGKTKEDKAVKCEILKSHTLEGVINLNKSTFYRVGTVPCAAVFTWANRT